MKKLNRAISTLGLLGAVLLSTVGSSAHAGWIWGTESAWMQVGFSPYPAADCMRLATAGAAQNARFLCTNNFGIHPTICAAAPIVQIIPLSNWFDGGSFRCSAQVAIAL